MTIIVDADACPVKDRIVRAAKKHKIPVIMVMDTSHEYQDGYSTVITVSKARDSADIALINRVQAGDVVITQDYGVAAMVLGKKAYAINQNGWVYTQDNIERLLFERHLGQKVRRSGGRTGNLPKRTKTMDEDFEKAFILLLTDILSKSP